MPETKKYLNRDGLEEYNSLLPHSSGEMQEYVNDWLDEHPEATTTVQDGAITEPKLADKSVSLRTLADDTVHMLKGMMLTREISGNVLSADDAYSAPPVSLDIAGKSTQDGTPTPDAPVEIDSIEVENLAATFAGKNLLCGYKAGYRNIGIYSVYSLPLMPNTNYFYSRAAGNSNALALIVSVSNEPLSENPSASKIEIATLTYYGGWSYNSTGEYKYMNFTIHNSAFNTSETIIQDRRAQFEVGNTATEYVTYIVPFTVQIPTSGHVLRSLPNGTHDTLSLTYLRPSTREGWAWYERVVERGVGIVTVSAFTSYVRRTRHGSNPGCVFGIAIDAPAVNVLGYCSHGVWVEGTTATENYGQFGMAWVTHNDPNLLKVTIAPDRSSLALGNEWLAENGPITFVYKLATPVTTTLDPIELPVLPAPDVTVWSDPTTGLQMQYIRDSNLVIQRIEEAIADQ